jgi:hypothetical protein
VEQVDDLIRVVSCEAIRMVVGVVVGHAFVRMFDDVVLVIVLEDDLDQVCVLGVMEDGRKFLVSQVGHRVDPIGAVVSSSYSR